MHSRLINKKKMFVYLFTGQNISDFEKVLRTIRELWYAPNNNNYITDVQYLQNYYSFIQRYVKRIN